MADPTLPGWRPLSADEDRDHWDRFVAAFGFLPSVEPADWPAISEPPASNTFDLTVPDGPAFAASQAAVNAEALRAFVTALPDVPELIVLDWQHTGYAFRPAEHLAGADPRWMVPVYPDGDYYAFLTPDHTAGTFGHPWERTLCVFGAPLVATLALTLGTWLPVRRVGGRPFRSPR
jgi:hypothetical protein